MFENFIIILLTIVGIFIALGLIFSSTTLYLNHLMNQEKEIHKKYSFEKEYIEKQVKELRKLENNYHDKIKILKDFCTEKDTFLKFYDKYKIYDLAETLMQERDNLNDYKKLFENKLPKKEKSVLWEYIGNTFIDLKIKECEDIFLRHDFYKDQ